MREFVKNQRGGAPFEYALIAAALGLALLTVAPIFAGNVHHRSQMAGGSAATAQ